ncbi:hypothetical protein [Clostridium botulinum]|uniref:hypothetical protein n=1 Tax=Clostridium botulinum TaxID=1491 RepID=UPI001E32D5F8|nr:hypothetical protein [Clostridium botulinum]MCD3202851.1 hypothetical protein [Clostridium botulinum C/D]MCD3230862.1 hypothetical protein [Clostridium botulinum C/D]MCD3253953.1 hypothetical protein [Clostridium botulinum C/D]MCD3279451.1 hypothetical protein [Clostridium botulinum C/D]MCD3282778.1 hypothetical protein [Clostridium botulinum C/D]
MKNTRWKKEAKKVKAECHKHSTCMNCKYNYRCDEISDKLDENNIAEFVPIRELEKALRY